MAIEQPYLLFLGGAADQLAAKTAQGVAHWRPEKCAGQLLRYIEKELDLPTLDAFKDGVAPILERLT